MNTTPKNDGFSDRERTAMKERAAELKADGKTRRGAAKAAADEKKVRETIAKMDPDDRALAERIHTVVTRVAPQLAPKVWYGQPAYAIDGTVVCFFRSGKKDRERYSIFGFTQEAALDDDSGAWATSFALTHLSSAAEQRLTKLIEQAVT
ncbi:MAG TPA: DUF1801 domain-containing protein [Candidatus Stackebrandtia excrementipullorum]|nr:DUF1801 domain-containing protein [Candidatus Stackebrandtia excrementipullorum]